MANNLNNTTTNYLFSFSTAAAVREELEALGIEGKAADLIVKQTAPARHAKRVQAVIEAAHAASKSEVENDGTSFTTACRAADVVALAIADMVGVGGHAGLTGEATMRIPAFSALGKGRKQAYDGPAWTAAIEEALYRVMNEVGAASIAIGLDFETDEVFLALDGPKPIDGGEATRLGWADLAQAGVPAAWLRSIAGNVVLALANGEQAITVGRDAVRVEGDLARWAKVFNGVADAR